MKRPTAVAVIGWAWIVLGGLACVGVVWGGLMFGMVTSIAREDPPPDEMAWFFPLVGAVLVAEAGIGILGIVAGAHFLKMRAWARTCLEVLSWLMVIGMAAYTVFFIVMFWYMESRATAQFDEPKALSLMRYAMPVMACVMMGAFATPFVFMIRGLRSAKVRAAIGRATLIRQEGQTRYADWGWDVCGDGPADEPSPLLIYPTYADPQPRLRFAGPGQYAVVTSSGVARTGVVPGTVVCWNPDSQTVKILAESWDTELAGNEVAVEAFIKGLMSGRAD